MSSSASPRHPQPHPPPNNPSKPSSTVYPKRAPLLIPPALHLELPSHLVLPPLPYNSPPSNPLAPSSPSRRSRKTKPSISTLPTSRHFPAPASWVNSPSSALTPG